MSSSFMPSIYCKPSPWALPPVIFSSPRHFPSKPAEMDPGYQLPHSSHWEKSIWLRLSSCFPGSPPTGQRGNMPSRGKRREGPSAPFHHVVTTVFTDMTNQTGNVFHGIWGTGLGFGLTGNSRPTHLEFTSKKLDIIYDWELSLYQITPFYAA